MLTLALLTCEFIGDLVERERPLRKQEVAEEAPADAREAVGLEREAHLADEPFVIACGHAGGSCVASAFTAFSIH